MDTNFVVGDVVTDGVRTGVVSPGFYWRDADDGTKIEPSDAVIAVQWEDGTQGYRKISQLDFA